MLESSHLWTRLKTTFGASRRPSPSSALFADVRQVCTVVEDFERTVRNLVDHWGIGPFKCWHFRPPQLYATTLRGLPAPWTMQLALTWLGDVQWEVIQPMQGETLYRKHLSSIGRGVQHVLMSSADVPFEQASARLAERGHGFAQTASVSIPARIGPLSLPALPRGLASLMSLSFGYVDGASTLRTSIEMTRYPPGVPERPTLRWGKAEYCVPAGDAGFERPLPNRRVRRVVKIGLVTRDLESTVAAWREVGGVAPWRVWDLGPDRLGHVSMAGAPASFRVRVAWGFVGRTLIEIVEPLDGASPYRDFLSSAGEGVAYVGVQPDGESGEQVVARAVGRGYGDAMQGSLLGPFGSTYVKARSFIGTDLEVIDTRGQPFAAIAHRPAGDRMID